MRRQLIVDKCVFRHKCGWVGGWVGGRVLVCVCACVCACSVPIRGGHQLRNIIYNT
jgi:hypothetical protein